MKKYLIAMPHYFFREHKSAFTHPDFNTPTHQHFNTHNDRRIQYAKAFDYS